MVRRWPQLLWMRLSAGPLPSPSYLWPHCASRTMAVDRDRARICQPVVG